MTPLKENVVARRGWAVAAAAAGTVGIAGGAFWLSFTALADLAERSGITAGQSWIWPLLVDGLIVVSTVAAVALDRHRGSWYPWALLVSGALVSVTANALHALVAADSTVPSLLAATVAAVPPLVLLASTHLTVVLIRSTGPLPADADVPSRLVPMAVPDEQDDQPFDDEPPRSPSPPLTPGSEPVAQSAASPKPETPVGVSPPPLTGQERRERAAELSRAGWSNKRIARELGVHPSTVGRWGVHLPTTSTADAAERTPEEIATNEKEIAS